MTVVTQKRDTGLNRFPFVSLQSALVLARVATALLFASHAVVRIAKGTIPNFALFMESVGLGDGFAVVWAITIVELSAAAMMILGVGVRVAALSLMAIAAGGIVLIHRHFGWFVGEHGTGGSEYSVALIVLLVVIAGSDCEADRDRAIDAAENTPEKIRK